WFHLTHLLVDGGKMSKSADNFYTLGQLGEAGFSAAELRYVLISAHYRQPLNFVAKDADGKETFPALLGARQALQRLAKADAALAAKAGSEASPDYATLLATTDGASFSAAFEALENDLNTPDALGKIFTAIKALDVASLSPAEAQRERLGFHRVLAALGLALPGIETEPATEAPAEIAALAKQRRAAKLAKDWPEADRLRNEIAALGWEVKDTKEGYGLSPKS
ncbi:MAG TPA: cysteine--tRNA ligase, partial [Bacteroidia bacterium]|nr:cysteine--tRNA ligase [Bacteroidia bacterium]